MAMDNLEISLDEAIQIQINRAKKWLHELRQDWEKEKDTFDIEILKTCGDLMLVQLQEQSDLIDDLWEMCKDG